MWISRIGAQVDAMLCPRYFPCPNQPLVIGKEHTLAGNQLFHQRGGLWILGHKTSNLVAVSMVIQQIRKDHSVPGREGHL
jgi:hypothetical protein